MSRNLFIVVSHGRYVRVTLKIQVNFRFCRNSRVLTVGSYGFSLFLHSLRFRDQGIYFSRCHKATMFGWPRKSRSTSGFGGTPGYCWFGLMDFSNSNNPYDFDVKESVFRGFAQPFFRVTSKIQVNFLFCRNSRVLTIGSYGFQKFLHSLRFRCQGICSS